MNIFHDYVCKVTGLPCSGCSFYCEHRTVVKSATVEPTNADKIRAMTDEELTAWLEDRFPLPINGLWLDWLKQEVE